MDNNNSSVWWGEMKKPETTQELVEQINDAIKATRQWLAAAEIKETGDNEGDTMMIEAQIDWLQDLINLADIQIKQGDYN